MPLLYECLLQTKLAFISIFLRAFDGRNGYCRFIRTIEMDSVAGYRVFIKKLWGPSQTRSALIAGTMHCSGNAYGMT